MKECGPMSRQLIVLDRMGDGEDHPADSWSIEARLLDGHYDRLLADFEMQLEQAAAALWRALAAIRAENTPRS